MNKKRILFVTESHHLASGFGTYSKQVLPRLYATGKYKLAEFASYGPPEGLKGVPWDYYGNLPRPEAQPEVDMYNSHQANHFGVWKFNEVLLHFRPDVVFSYRDPWMDDWISKCPLRKYFHWAWMPTVDSAPQQRRWLEDFAKCDALFAYSEFGLETLKEQSHGRLNVRGCASPGIDPDIYVPVPDKRAHKESLGINPDWNIVGTVMRNQTRKLFVELIKSFRIFLDNAPSDLAKNSFLYLHTSYPERSGWDIGAAILEFDVGDKVLATYICKECKRWSPSKFKGPIRTCKHCGNRSCFMPHVSSGLSIPDLIKVYNLFDLYAQYAICEGFGMPQVEAAACGVPITATNYSAMVDVLRETKGFPINIDKMYREKETGADRAYPSNAHLAEIIQEFFSESQEYRDKKGEEARTGAITRYNWDDTAKAWEKYADEYLPVGLQGQWNAPADIYDIPEPPEGMSPQDLVNWSYYYILRSPEEALSYEAQQAVSNLNFGSRLDGSLEEYNQTHFMAEMNNRAHAHNAYEQRRVDTTSSLDLNYFNKGVGSDS